MSNHTGENNKMISKLQLAAETSKKLSEHVDIEKVELQPIVSDSASDVKGETATSIAVDTGKIKNTGKAVGRPGKWKKVLGIVAGSVVGVVVVAYLGVAIYFMGHFGFQTSVNGVDVSCMALAEADSVLADVVDEYQLLINGRTERSTVVKPSDISMVTEQVMSMKELKKQQNAFLWAYTYFKQTDLTLEYSVTFDEEALYQCLNSSDLFKVSGYDYPDNAKIIYDGTGYVIQKETDGNAIHRDRLLVAVGDALKALTLTLDLNQTDCYLVADIREDNELLVKQHTALAPYGNATLTYDLGLDQYQITPDMYLAALEVSDSGNVQINSGYIAALVQKAAVQFDTAGSTRQFKTSEGLVVNVKGPYGYTVDQEAEVVAISKMIRNKESETRTPIYSKSGFGDRRSISNDIGSTYVEINLTDQYLYVYYQGDLYLESDIVSGNPNQGHRTPSGIFGVTYKQSPAILRGPDYESPVTYWMPFNGGIGLHDATWQPGFGGNRYLYHGSHGCINLPFHVARKIYQICEVGLPVICYYEGQ